MGLTFRQSVSAGPFRFNLSDSGIGVSVGVPGFRVGTGPRGHYVSISAGGLRYRQALAHGHSGRPISVTPPRQSLPEQHRIESYDPTVAPMRLIESADISHLADSTANDVLQEIQTKRTMMVLWPWPLALVAGLLLYEWYMLLPTVPVWAMVLMASALVGTLVGTFWLHQWDTARRSTVLLYDMDGAASQVYENLLTAFEQLQHCQRAWRIEAQARVLNGKYHAGAGTNVRRTLAGLLRGGLRPIKCNVDVPCLRAGDLNFYFYPDVVLMEKNGQVASCSYGNFRATSGHTRFIEADGVPGDSAVVGQTWRFVNKNGGPDRRFNNNRQLPIVSYGELNLSSTHGVQEKYHFSSPIPAQRFEQAITGMMQFNANRGSTIQTNNHPPPIRTKS
jgi:Protein of unknown function (DUF4236)